MVYSACVAWFQDWIEANPPTLVDELDLHEWMEQEMKGATQVFLQEGFRSKRARNDALLILRSLYYEYYLFERERYIAALRANPDPVVRLPALPQSAQKSAAWHAESREMLSGHEFGPVCVGSPAEFTATVAKKCQSIGFVEEDAGESATVFLTSEEGTLSAFKWGWRYEPVARDLFEAILAEGKVFDGLGRVRHPTLPRLGASPDGLIMTGPKQGRLLEIKCPPTRVLDGKVPIRYYAQMQLQAEVCGVEAVEYVEVQFSAKPKAQCTPEILQKSHRRAPWMGVVAVVAESVDALPASYRYVYSPLFPATAEGYVQTMEWAPEGIALELSVWIVKDWFHQTVPRNYRWWKDVGYPGYVRFWETVDAARKDGRFKPTLLRDDESSVGGEEERPDPVADDVSLSNSKRPSLLRDESSPEGSIADAGETAENNRASLDAAVVTDAPTTAAVEGAAESVAETTETKASDSPTVPDSSA